MKWNLPAVNEMEIDQFDHDQTYYLIYRTTPNSPILASIRMTPTTVPNLTTDVFSSLITQKEFLQPRPDQWEISRFVLHPDIKINTHISSLHFGMLVIAGGLLEFGLSKNIKNYITITMPHIARILNLIGWPIKRIGEPNSQENGKAIPAILDVNQHLYEQVYKKLSNLEKTHMLSETTFKYAV